MMPPVTLRACFSELEKLARMAPGAWIFAPKTVVKQTVGGNARTVTGKTHFPRKRPPSTDEVVHAARRGNMAKNRLRLDRAAGKDPAFRPHKFEPAQTAL